MTVPKINDLFIPLLETIKDKDEYKIKEVTDDVIDLIDISDEDKEIKLPNGETVIESRISTANTYLKKAELVESNRFLYYNITEEGLRVLEENPDGIDEEYLMQYPGFKELKSVMMSCRKIRLNTSFLKIKRNQMKSMELKAVEITLKRIRKRRKNVMASISIIAIIIRKNILFIRNSLLQMSY